MGQNVVNEWDLKPRFRENFAISAECSVDVVSDQWLKSLGTWAKSWQSSGSIFQSCRELGCVETPWRQDPASVHLVSQRSIFRASACGKVVVALRVVSVQGQLRSHRSLEQQEKVALLLLDLDGMQCELVASLLSPVLEWAGAGVLAVDHVIPVPCFNSSHATLFLTVDDGLNLM